jgi:hypothetical protein
MTDSDLKAVMEMQSSALFIRDSPTLTAEQKNGKIEWQTVMTIFDNRFLPSGHDTLLAESKSSR